ncbi:MAG: RHS repeat domain-containing protein, partial [Thermoanaerobaculia bacterium]
MSQRGCRPSPSTARGLTKLWPAGQHHKAFCRSALGPLLTAAVLSAGTLAGADSGQPAETLPGFKANNLFEAKGIDNVNLFSGDPGIVVPLGPEYPLGPDSSWQLQAYYSGKLWFFDQSCGTLTDYSHAYVRGYPTLGAGWTLTLGYVHPGIDADEYATAGYYSPDGGRHGFIPGIDPVPYVTKDGSRLRITPLSNPVSYKVEFPDGSVQILAHQFRRPRPTAGTSLDLTDVVWDNVSSTVNRFGLTEIHDRFGTTLLQVDYVSNDPASPSAWQVSAVRLRSDSPNPQRTISFNWGTQTVGSVSWAALDSITFPTSNGTLTTAFSHLSQAGWNRSIYDNSTVGTPPCLNPKAVFVPLLSAITLSGPGVVSPMSYSFGYHLPPIGSPDAPRDGILESVTLPTGGRIDYVHGPTAAPAPSTDPETGGPFSGVPVAPCAPDTGPQGPQYSNAGPKFDASAAVESRTETDPSTGQVSTTTYTRADTPVIGPAPSYADNCGVARTVIVKRPAGNGSSSSLYATRHIFHVSVSSTDEAGGIELERRIYADSSETGTPIRTVVNCYQGGEVASPPVYCGYRTPAVGGDPGNKIQDYQLGPNPRLQASTTWYGVNPLGGGVCQAGAAPCLSSVQSDYRLPSKRFATATTSAVGRPMLSGWTSRQEHTELFASNWLLDLYTSKSTTENGTGLPGPTGISSSFSFDTFNGFLNSTSASDLSYGTLSHLFTRDPLLNNPVTETIQSSGAAMDGRTFTKNNTFLNGQLLTSQGTGMTWNSVNLTRDPATGLVTKSRDPALLETNYVHDALGRLTSVAPPGGEALTGVCYDAPTSTTVYRASSTQACPVQGSSSAALTWQQYLYDNLGRLTREIRRMPIGFSARTHGYDLAGHAYFVSEWKDCSSPSGDCLAASPPGTTSSDFDPFDRPRRATAADGAITQIDFADGAILHSDWRKAVKVCVNGQYAGTPLVCGGGGTEASTAYQYDPLGRLLSVTEPNTFSTPYQYNALDKLTSVTQTGLNQSGNQVTQTRAFAYDALGFLRSSTSPELISAGNATGLVTYSQYDALGNLTRSVEANNLILTRTYDTTGRLLTLDSSEGRPYTTLTYDGSCGPGAGKVATRSANNYPTATAVPVSETFCYDPATGRFNQRDLTVPGRSAPLTTKWTYNTLGLTGSIEHLADGISKGKIQNTFDHGYPMAVTGAPDPAHLNPSNVATNILYNPAGGLASFVLPTHSVTVTQDPSLLPRPSRIFTSLGLWDSGLYSYDGAGNIKAMTGGTVPASFQYDPLSRITQGSVAGSSENYGYDRWGNLIQKASPSPNLAVDASTNRMSAATYDALGNMTSYLTQARTFDALSRLASLTDTGVNEVYLYDGAGERVAVSGLAPPPPPLTIFPDQTDLEFCSGQYSFGATIRLTRFELVGGTPPLTWTATSSNAAPITYTMD